MGRLFALGYGVAAYLAFQLSFLGVAAFLVGIGPFAGIDERQAADLPVGLAIDLALIAVFGISHSVMARPGFKARWTRVVPPVVERSTYVLVTSLCFGLIIWQWRSLPAVVWHVEHAGARAAIWTIGGAGAALLVYATFLTDHFDLFGLRQVWLQFRGRPYTPVPFQERSVYRFVRHPMMVGVLVFFWAAPTMSVGHLVFALGMTGYVLVGVALEERDLGRELPESYQLYRRRVRAFIPLRRGR